MLDLITDKAKNENYTIQTLSSSLGHSADYNLKSKI